MQHEDPAVVGPFVIQEWLGSGAMGLRPEGLRYVAAGLAEALVAIHRAGVVHRDLKPSNIVLTDDGPRVIDFGIARALEDVNLTATGIVVGTPGYLSPEELTGAPIGSALDLVSLGGVLVFAATGQGPFGRGPLSALMHRVVHEQPRIPPLPDDLTGVVQGCLSRSPDQRPTPADIVRILNPVQPVPLPIAGTMRFGVAPTRIEGPTSSRPGGPADRATAQASRTGGNDVRHQSHPLRGDGRAAAGRGARFLDVVGPVLAVQAAVDVVRLAGGVRDLRLVLPLAVAVGVPAQGPLTGEGMTVTRGSRTGSVAWASVSRVCPGRAQLVRRTPVRRELLNPVE